MGTEGQMRFTPGLLCVAAKICLAIATGLVLVADLLFGRAVSAAHPASSSLADSSIGFFYTLLFYAALPKLQRAELTAIALLIFIIAEASHAIADPPVSLSVLIFRGAGVLAAFAPGQVERLRALHRAAPYKAFSDIKQEDRRQAHVRALLVQPSAACSRAATAIRL